MCAPARARSRIRNCEVPTDLRSYGARGRRCRVFSLAKPLRRAPPIPRSAVSPASGTPVPVWAHAAPLRGLPCPPRTFLICTRQVHASRCHVQRLWTHARVLHPASQHPAAEALRLAGPSSAPCPSASPQHAGPCSGPRQPVKGSAATRAARRLAFPDRSIQPRTDTLPGGSPSAAFLIRAARRPVHSRSVGDLTPGPRPRRCCCAERPRPRHPAVPEAGRGRRLQSQCAGAGLPVKG